MSKPRDYRCEYQYPGQPVRRCVHRSCRWLELRKAGKGNIADRLQVNATAKDWASNWGRMLYDPKNHGRNFDRRYALARAIRAMRAGGDYAELTLAACWTGALM